MEILSKIVHKNFNQDLIILFFDLSYLVKIPKFSQILLQNSDFFQILLSLVFLNDKQASSKLVSQNFHRIVGITFKSLKKMLKNVQDKDIISIVFTRNIWEQILNKIEFYFGGMPLKQKKAPNSD